MAENLPDVFLLSVFKKLNANDRLSACQVCTSWFLCVQSVNQTLKSLTFILSETCVDELRSHQIDENIFGYNPNVKQQLIKTANPENLNKEKIELSSDKNTMQFYIKYFFEQKLNSITVQQIITAFPATTIFNFFNLSNSTSTYDYLTQFLETNDQEKNIGWKQNLTTLRIFDFYGTLVSTQTNQRLFNSINCLPVLKRFVFEMCNQKDEGFLLEHNLSILASLKKVRFLQHTDQNLDNFLKSVQKYAAENDDLQIDLPKGFTFLKNFLKNHNNKTPLLDDQIRKKITRLNSNPDNIDNLTDLKIICMFFPNLTSLSIKCTQIMDCEPKFELISRHLRHLCHLMIKINFGRSRNIFYESEDDELENNQIIFLLSPTSKMLSIKTLELAVTINSHSDLQWLNFQNTLPNLNSIHFTSFICKKCQIKCWEYYENHSSTSPKLTSIKKCFKETFTQLHQVTSVPLEQITVSVDDGNLDLTAKQLLNKL